MLNNTNITALAALRSCGLALLAMLSVGCAAKYPRLNPLRGQYRSILVAPAKQSVQRVMAAHIAAGRAEQVSVYYQSLPTGYWFGVNEQEKFLPASLLKVYLAVAVMKAAEEDPALLSREIAYLDLQKTAAPGVAPSPEIPLRCALLPGGRYSVAAVLEGMLRYSDNNAAYNLRAHLPDEYMAKVYGDFGLQVSDDGRDFITVKQCMMLILSLYNSTYLRPEMSQRLLGWLTEGAYKNGLAAGIPPGIALANKFGERAVAGEGRVVRQLHDCGIVYYEPFPYMLCVMTRGTDIDGLQSVIRSLSGAVYTEISSRVGTVDGVENAPGK